MDYKNKYLKYKNKYLELEKQHGGVIDKIRCENFIEQIYTVCPDNESMYYHGMTVVMYLILLLNSFMIGKDHVDFPRLLNINNEVIYSQDDNQIINREEINNFNNYNDTHTFLRKSYPVLYSSMAIDNYSKIKDHLLSVTISNNKLDLKYGESFLGGYNKSRYFIASHEKQFILCLIYYFIPGIIFDKPGEKKLEDRDSVIKECMNIIIKSINICGSLLDNNDEFDCSLYGIVLCISMNNPAWVYNSMVGGHINTSSYKENQARIVINNKSVEDIKVVGIHGSIIQHKNFKQIHDIMFNTSQEILCILHTK